MYLVFLLKSYEYVANIRDARGGITIVQREPLKLLYVLQPPTSDIRIRKKKELLVHVPHSSKALRLLPREMMLPSKHSLCVNMLLPHPYMRCCLVHEHYLYRLVSPLSLASPFRFLYPTTHDQNIDTLLRLSSPPTTLKREQHH